MHLQGEIMNMVLHHVKTQMQDMRLALIGYIADYDIDSHCVSVILPAIRDENNKSMVFEDIPLGSFAVGNNCGIMYRPHGGASQANPTAGEQVLVQIIERETGYSAVACMLFSDLQPPPYQIDNTTIQPGELIIKNETGTYIRQRATGDVEVHAARDAIITSARDCNITASPTGRINILGDRVNINSRATSINLTANTDVNIQANGLVIVGAPLVQVSATVSATVGAPIVNVTGAQVNLGIAGAYFFLLTSAFLVAYNTHTHTDSTTGLTGPPNVPVTAVPPIVTVATAAN